MKKLALITLAAGLAGSTFAQGTVNFGNAGVGTAISNILTQAAVPAGTSFMVSLYFLPDTGSTPTTADFDANVTILTPNSGFASPGLFVGGVRTAPVAGGATAWFQVRAWETAFGNAYASAVSNPNQIGGRLALAGTSTILKVTTGNPGGSPPTPAASLVTAGLKGFYVVPVPEPATIGLGLLGLGALLLLRRRS